MNDFQENLTEKIKNFVAERNWEQFHNGKDLAMCLSIESNEVLELFLWKQNEEVNNDKLQLELGDVFYSLLLIADKYSIDLEQSLIAKMQVNMKKYPVAKAYGVNKKYNEL